jgi:DNA-binding PadR family transcriptional regulator
MTRSRRGKISNPLGLAVLALLKERPMHPYEMASTLRERAKEQSIKLNYGSLYAVIGALQREGMVRAGETVRDGARPEKTVYRLTDRGDRELGRWMADLLGRPVKEYPKFEAALSLMPVLPPDEVAGLLEERLERLDSRISERRSIWKAGMDEGLERLFGIEIEYEIAMDEAEREWVAGLLELIRNSPEFTKTWRAFHERAAT